MKQVYFPPEAEIVTWQATDIITASGVSLFDATGDPIGDSFDDIEGHGG